jgi:hypothetical protein
MTTAYTSLLGLALPVQGELSGTWGDVVNNSITSLVDTSVAGTTNVSTDGDVTLTTTTGAANTARQAILLFSGARTAIRTVTAPAQSKIYTVINATTGGFAVQLVGAGPTTGVTIPNGTSATVAWNGSDFIGVSAVSSSDAYIYGVRVGRGGGAVATNTAVGNGAIAATATGIRNVAVGHTALPAVTSGNNNVGVGFQAGNGITSGSQNIGVGSFTLNLNTTGLSNVSIGHSALAANTTASSNTAVGDSALYSNTTASGNTAIGLSAAYSNTTGADIVAVGFQSGYSNTTGAHNIAMGRDSLFKNTTGNYNTAIGGLAGYQNQTGSYNSYLGYAAGNGNTGSNTKNTGVGYGALNSISTGNYNTSIGSEALQTVNTGSYNCAVGWQAGIAITTGQYNVSMGRQALSSVTTANENTAIGQQALYYATGANNTAIGTGSGSQVTTGSNNTIIGGYNGNQGGLDIRTSSNNIVLSDGDGNPRAVVNSSGWLSATNSATGYFGLASHVFAANIDQGVSIFQIITGNYGGQNIARFYGVTSESGINAGGTAMGVAKNGGTNRSINASGTINASGADYAEYMVKDGNFTVAKGDVVGINAQGKLTNVFADAISFIVKSTDPSYVGGDSWGTAESIGVICPEQPNTDATDEEKAQYEADKAVFDAALEAARQTVDRVAFAGQVPVNVTGATAGQYIVPINDNGSIKGQAVSNPTFEQYQSAVGKVIAIEADGRARIIVKVA